MIGNDTYCRKAVFLSVKNIWFQRVMNDCCWTRSCLLLPSLSYMMALHGDCCMNDTKHWYLVVRLSLVHPRQPPSISPSALCTSLELRCTRANRSPPCSVITLICYLKRDPICILRLISWYSRASRTFNSDASKKYLFARCMCAARNYIGVNYNGSFFTRKSFAQLWCWKLLR